jgi:hypothetical protein
VVGPLATGPAGRRQQRSDFGPGLVGELVAADHATSHIQKLAAARTYNTAVRQALAVLRYVLWACRSEVYPL